MCVDPTENHGRMLISHYMYDTKRADCPVVELRKDSNTVLFNKYYRAIKNLLDNSIKIKVY